MKKTKEPKDPKDQKAVKKTVVRTLLCELSEKEMAKLGPQLAENMDKIEAIEAQKKVADDGFKKDIGMLEEVSTKLRNMLRSGGEEREVKCEEVTDYRAGEVRVTRLDTKETFSKRTMTKDEMQLPLDAQKPAGKLLAMDGGKGQPEEETCGECHGIGKTKMGNPPLDVKCEECDGSGKVPAKHGPLKATLGDVAATHAQNKQAAEEAEDTGGKGHPEVERMLAKQKRGKAKKDAASTESAPPIDPDTGEPLAF